MSISLTVTEDRIPNPPKGGALLTADFDEGRWVHVGCLACRNELAVVCIAQPFRMYHEALECTNYECCAEIVRFDHLTERVVTKEDF